MKNRGTDVHSWFHSLVFTLLSDPDINVIHVVGKDIEYIFLLTYHHFSGVWLQFEQLLVRT